MCKIANIYAMENGVVNLLSSVETLEIAISKTNHLTGPRILLIKHRAVHTIPPVVCNMFMYPREPLMNYLSIFWIRIN